MANRIHRAYVANKIHRVVELIVTLFLFLTTLNWIPENLFFFCQIGSKLFFINEPLCLIGLT